METTRSVETADRIFNRITTIVNMQKSMLASFASSGDFLDSDPSENYANVAKIMSMLFAMGGEMTKGYVRDVALHFKTESDALDDVLCAIDEATTAGNSYFEKMASWIQLAREEMNESRNRAFQKAASSIRSKGDEPSFDLIRDPNCRSWGCCPARCPSPTEEEQKELDQCPFGKTSTSSDK